MKKTNLSSTNVLKKTAGASMFGKLAQTSRKCVIDESVRTQSKLNQESAQANSNSPNDQPRLRRVIFVRHGQRVDRYLALTHTNIKKEWVDVVFPPIGNKAGCRPLVYRPMNMEMPLYLPKRPILKEYNDDPPITTMGEMSAQLLGSR